MEGVVVIVLVAGGLVLALRKRVRRVSYRARRLSGRTGRGPILPAPDAVRPRPGPRTAEPGEERDVFDADSAVPVAPGTQVLEGRAYVVDGDGLVIRKTQIRLFGIDAPEMNHPYGKTAKSALIRLCKGQVIRAEVTAVDDHGRTVARCTLPDGRDLSAEMVKLGLAIDWAKFSGGVYRALEVPDARKKMWLADARQKGRMHVWAQYEARRSQPSPR